MSDPSSPETRPLNETKASGSMAPEAHPDTRGLTGMQSLPENERLAESFRHPLGHRSLAGRLLLAGLGLLVATGFGMALDALVSAILGSESWYHWALLVGCGLLLLGSLLLGLRELGALLRLKRLTHLQARSHTARQDASEARSLLDSLLQLYCHRPVSEWAVASWREREGDLTDDREKLEAFERDVLGQLDQRATAIITAATRRSGFINMLSPFAIFDMLATAIIDLRMVARLARLYGGRPGGLVSLRLLRIAFLDVVAAGTLEAADETLGDLVGAGVTARLSGKAGTALVNGLFTARLGLAAVEACRPMDWQTGRPSARRLVMQALYPRRSRDNAEELDSSLPNGRTRPQK
ncbi:TIGR01620 family protein [Fodinicurvata sediminis]|uniref:TIGR01620 family protein n=1 Tax=Fodinicurvata sediminis TaxID=1121832 RepID=UPI0003B67E3E|nr:TIGR01620 family protein [Fodinicurvata sediminis]